MDEDITHAGTRGSQAEGFQVTRIFAERRAYAGQILCELEQRGVDFLSSCQLKNDDADLPHLACWILYREVALIPVTYPAALRQLSGDLEIRQWLTSSKHMLEGGLNFCGVASKDSMYGLPEMRRRRKTVHGSEGFIDGPKAQLQIANRHSYGRTAKK